MGNRPPLSPAPEKLHRRTEELPPLAPGCPPVSLPPWNNAWNRHLAGRAPVGGCLYGGQNATLWAPMDDFLHITDGPVGCGVYAQGARLQNERGRAAAMFDGLDLTTDFQERDVVFGGERKLAHAVAEAEALFPHHRGMTLLATCPIALIGDDIEGVARQQSARLGKPVVAVNCAGFRRADGIGDTHRTIFGTWRDWAEPQSGPAQETSGARDVVLLCRGLDGAADDIAALLGRLGLRVIARWPGRSGEVARLGRGRLVVSIGMDYWARRLQMQFGTPWVDADFCGSTATAESLRAIAARFDAEVAARAEDLITSGTQASAAVLAETRERLQGRLYLSMTALHPRDLRVFHDFGIRAGSALQGWPDRAGRWQAIAAPRRYHEMTPEQVDDLLQRAQPDLVDGPGQDALIHRKRGFSVMDDDGRRDLQQAHAGFAGIARLAATFVRLFDSPVRRLRTPPWPTAGR